MLILFGADTLNPGLTGFPRIRKINFWVDSFQRLETARDPSNFISPPFSVVMKLNLNSREPILESH